MGPLFNPLYWVVGLAAIAIGGALAGIVAFSGYMLLRKAASRSSVLSRVPPLPLAVVLAVVVFATVTCSICNWSLSDPNLPRAKPKHEDIVGRWVPSPSSLEKMAEQGGYPISFHELVFDSDGTFTMANMPDWWLNAFGESTGGFYSGHGTWSIDQPQPGRWAVEVRFSSLSAHGQTMHPTPAPWDSTAPIDNLGTSFDLSGRDPPYVIVIYLGDPDSADVIVFHRLEDTTP